MKKTKMLYWIFTGLFGTMMLLSAIPDIMMVPMAMEGMHDKLGYPVYFVPFIGVAKLLGVIAILIPGFPRIKEWAYAGLVFDLVGATFSIIAYGGSTSEWLPMILPLSLAGLSYTSYQKKLRLSRSQTAEQNNTNVAISNAILQ